jgi:hypothetical protein
MNNSPHEVCYLLANEEEVILSPEHFDDALEEQDALVNRAYFNTSLTTPVLVIISGNQVVGRVELQPATFKKSKKGFIGSIETRIGFITAIICETNKKAYGITIKRLEPPPKQTLTSYLENIGVSGSVCVL